RQEDHGLSQLEALAAGAALVTVPSEGPYEALPMAMQLDRALVAPSLSREALAFAIRSGFNVDLDDYGKRAAELLKPYTPEAVREVFTERVLPALGLGADVVHFHNIQPLLGSRSLAAARETGARVVMHLHNFRLFCAIGVSFRFGRPCFRCHDRWTAPGLALNCRDSLPEAAAYAYALSSHQADVFESIDRFVTPSRYAAVQLEKLGLPAGRTEVIPHYIPAPAFAEQTRADRGQFALAFGRLAAEKGFECAIDGSAISGVPLKIAGEGPLEQE